MDLPEPTLTLCEFEGCSSPLPQGDNHPFCLRHATCWVGDSYDPESCETCSPLVLQFTHSSSANDRILAAVALQARFSFLQHARLVTRLEASELPRLGFRDRDLGALVASTLVPSVPPFPSQVGVVRPAPFPLLSPPKRLRVSKSGQGLDWVEALVASGAASSNLGSEVVEPILPAEASGAASSNLGAEVVEPILPAEASGLSQPPSLSEIYPLESGFSSGVMGMEESSAPVLGVPRGRGESAWSAWAPFDPAWALVPSREGLLLQGKGFSYPPSLYEFELEAASPRVRFRVPFGSLDSSFRRFPPCRISPGEVREALSAYLLQDPVYASVMDPASFEFGSSSPYWVRYQVPESSLLADCPLFSLKAWRGFCRTRKLDSREVSSEVQVFLGGSLKFLNECLFAPMLPRDVGLVQLHAQVPTLSAVLVAEDFRTRSHLASVLRLFGLLELYSDWFSEDVGALSEGSSDVVLVSAAQASSALLKLFAPILQEAVSMFFSSRLACRKAVLALSLDSVWALALQFSSPFCSLLFPEDIVAQFLSAASTSCRPILDLLVVRGGRSQSSQFDRARVRASVGQNTPLVPEVASVGSPKPSSSGRRSVRSMRRRLLAGCPIDGALGGRLARFACKWSHDSWAYRVVSSGLCWHWVDRPPMGGSGLRGQPSSPSLDQVILEWLRLGVVETTSSLKWVSRLFPVPKRDCADLRYILDLSRLNRLIPCPSFRTTTLSQVRLALESGTWMVSLNIRDAYWHVPVHPGFRDWLGFKVGRQAYRFRCLPFGLHLAPRVFTRLAQVVVARLRLLGVRVLAYLDDWLVWAPTRSACLLVRDLVLSQLAGFGFLVNWQKSQLVPSQVRTWRGLIWDSQTTSISLPPVALLRLQSSRHLFLRGTRVTRRLLEQLCGSLSFALVVFPLGRFWLQRLNWYLRSRIFRRTRNRWVRTPGSLCRLLRHRLPLRVFRGSVPWRLPLPSLDVFTDASSLGWGFVTSAHQTGQGRWGRSFRQAHSMVREFAAVWQALRRIQLPRGSLIQLHSDCSPVVNCLNRGGSLRSMALWGWSLRVALLLSSRGLALRAVHVRGVSNVIADGLSRFIPLPTEWTVDDASFHWLCQTYGQPEVDLFASAWSRRLPLYVAPFPDCEAVAVDAFQQDWSRWGFLYLFPPVQLLLQVLARLESYHGRVLLLAPWSPTQPWFQVLLARCPNPRLFPRLRLYQQFGPVRHHAGSHYCSALRVWSF
ncbi:uncharacterized protein [Procambarus clarkii]|uniref:uncharacterized protein n=1 Tax=Procambarus clarkii TaxID=6728 RepID=UPI003742C14B